MTRPPHSPADDILRLLMTAGYSIAVTLSGCSQSQQHGSVQAFHAKDAPSGFEMRQDRPPTPKTLLSMADILAAQGKDPQCEFILSRCIQEYPTFMPAFNKFAELLMRQGRVNEAITALSTAVEIRPGDPMLLNNLGMCLLIRKEYAESLDCFTRAAGLQPECKKYRANMASALGLLGRYEESSALLQQVLLEQQATHNAQILHDACEKADSRSTETQG